jgi:hypothetical protein
MADVKISGLPASTLPLAGTEVLPLVQSGVTKKVATDDLTVKNVRSNATTGILQVAGPAIGATRVMTTPDANFTAARTDAAQSFTGDQTLATGNLVIGTSGKGIDFSANPAAPGVTSELLNDYETGTWTPDLQFGGANTGITYTVQNGYYTKIGNIVTGTAWILLTSKGSATGDATLAGLPFANAAGQNQSPCSIEPSSISFADQMVATVEKIFTFIKLREITNGGGNSALTDADFSNSSSLQISFTYRAA